jgi:type 2 lantibiotic biosynthesis protein LanM
LTLEERAALHADSFRSAFLTRRTGRKKAANWFALSGFSQNNNLIDKRLEIAHCTKKAFSQIIGTDPWNLGKHPASPAWLERLQEADACSSSAEIAHSIALQEYLERGLLAPFSNILNFYVLQLQVGCLEIDPNEVLVKREDVPDLFVASFLEALEQKVRRAVVLEINVLRLKGLLSGESPSARYDSFRTLCFDREYRWSFLSKYPVLLRLLYYTLEFWLESSIELFSRLAADRTELAKTLGIATQHHLKEISRSGDTHDSGRSVCILTFSSGQKTVYKPRNLSLDREFQRFISWFNRRHGKSPLKILRIVSRNDYGWVEYAENVPTKERRTHELFYYRVGLLLSITHVLHGVDFHFENLVAASEGPVLVDLETLFHTPLESSAVKSAFEAALHEVLESVMGIGLLPQPTLNSDNTEIFDVSGLGASPEQTAPYTVLGIEKFGRDDVSIKHIPGWIPSTHSNPDVDNSMSLPKKEILSGFREGYITLESHKKELLSQEGPLMPFSICVRRVIVRDTKRYGELQMDECHPDLLRDQLDRQWHWDNLWTDILTRPILNLFVKSELSQVGRGDIPHFSGLVGETSVRGTDGTVIELASYQSEPPISVVRSRIASLSKENLHKQEWFLRASLGYQDKRTLSQGIICSEESFLSNAIRIGDVVLDSLVYWEDRAWFNTAECIFGENQNDKSGFRIAPAGWSMYDGAVGVALFLAYLGDQSGERKFTDTAMKLIREVEKQLEGSNITDTGGFTGVASVVYAFTHLAALTGEPGLLESAEKLLPKILASIENDNGLDVLSGAAGQLLAVMPMSHMDRTGFCKKIVQATLARLAPLSKLDSELHDLPYARGLSHGLSGIALALLKIGKVLKDERTRERAIQVMLREQRLTNNGQWTDSHKINGRCQVSWCHGAPGIAIALFSFVSELKNSEIEQYLTRALDETVNYPWLSSHCLCHGSMGNIEPLIMAASHKKYAHYDSTKSNIVQEAIRHIEREGFTSILPNQTLSIGLMTGLTGVGYSFLRLNNPQEIPSILGLESPKNDLFTV